MATSVILLGGRTGRDVAAQPILQNPTLAPVRRDSCRVQRVNAPVERKLPASSAVRTLANSLSAATVRLWCQAAFLIAIRWAADGLDVNLDAVPKKLRRRLTALSWRLEESQERLHGRCSWEQKAR